MLTACEPDGVLLQHQRAAINIGAVHTPSGGAEERCLFGGGVSGENLPHSMHDLTEASAKAV